MGNRRSANNRGTAEPQAQAAPAGEMYRGEGDGWKQLGPLPNRLYAALEARKLKRTDLARIFGVSSAAVTYWLRGLKLGEDASEAKPIPEDLGRLMVRWLETRQEPTQDELAALPSRSRTPRGRTKKDAAKPRI
jgi:transcriptional regulator with XRE-family HTH domain